MSSDFGTNKDRVDIKLNCKDSEINTIEGVIEAITQGATVIRADLSIDSNNYIGECYSNDIYKAFKAIGIDDIRYGSMGYQLGGGDGYTLYKPEEV